MSLSNEAIENVKNIPGGEGFWKSSSESTYISAARTLKEKGMDEDEIIEFLRDLYYAAAACYGG